MYKCLVNKELILMALIQLCFGMFGAFIVVTFINHETKPVIATVNIVELENSFIKETLHQALSEDEKEKKVTVFANKLNQAVIKLAKNKHLILVPSEAVLAGSVDVTDEIANDIKKGMT